MNMQNKFVKVLFGEESHFGNKIFKYKIGEVNIAENWNPENREDIGGFSVSNITNIARWIVRGDTLYDVILPDDAEIVEIDHQATGSSECSKEILDILLKLKEKYNEEK